MTSTKTRGPYAKTAERKASIAEAALELIRESGHRSLLVADVARRAGVSERTLFYHFPTRDHVLVAALERVDELSQAEVEAQYAAVPDDLERLIELLKGQGSTFWFTARLQRGQPAQGPELVVHQVERPVERHRQAVRGSHQPRQPRPVGLQLRIVEQPEHQAGVRKVADEGDRVQHRALVGRVGGVA